MSISRRSLFVGATLPLLAAGAAKADTAFTVFAFPATGGSASRTEPNRWADWHNVLDFGADSTGVADSTAAIQAAIDWTANDQRGTIYFPRGTYKITAPLVIYFGTGADQSICFRGDGTATRLQGSVNGFLIDRRDPTLATPSSVIVIEKLFVSNTSTTLGTGAVRLGNCNSAVVRDCQISGMNGVVFNQPADDPTVLSENCSIVNCTFNAIVAQGAGTTAVVTGNGTTIINMDCSNWECAIRLIGSGNNIVSGRFEVNVFGFIFGVDQAGNTVAASGCSLGGFSMESQVDTFIDMIHASGCVLYSCGGAAFNGAVYGLRLRSGVTGNVFVGTSFSGGYTTSAISIEDASSPGIDNIFIGCNAANSTGGADVWTMPTKAATAQFINCNNQAPIFTFANLPSSGQVYGDEYIISNSTLATSAANFGSVVAGGGANTAKVRWNGSNWIIV